MATCSICESYWPDEGKTCWGCLMGKACESPERCGTPIIHECPEPYPPEQAEYLYNFFMGSGVPTSQRTRARILRGLQEGAADALSGSRAV